jgi:hypothetical protein
MIGLWTTAANDPESLLGFPYPQSLVDRTWEAERRGRIVAYLRGGHTRATFMGHSFCRFENCDADKRHTLGSRELTDAWHGFVPPQVAGDLSKSVDIGYWVRWVAENTTAPCGSPEACSLEEAQVVCSELSTERWRASVASEYDRWKVRRETDTDAFEDFTGPISRASLRAYLFRFRLLAPTAVLSPEQAIDIASSYASDGHAAQLLGGATDTNGEVWWALITSVAQRPTVPFSEIDFNAIKIPTPGWTVFLKGGWKVDVARGMDEQTWRFFLEDWRRRVGLSVGSEPSAGETPTRV